MSYQNLFGIVCIYLSFVSFVWNQIQKYFLQLEHHIEHHSTVKPSIWGVTLSENVPWVFVYLAVVLHIVFSFLYFHRFNCSNSLVPFPFLLHHYIGEYYQNGTCETMNSHHKIIIWHNVTCKVYWDIQGRLFQERHTITCARPHTCAKAFRRVINHLRKSNKSNNCLGLIKIICYSHALLNSLFSCY